jgi:protochlorophyllide reductase
MSCRDIKKADAAKSSILVGSDNVQIMQLDLAELKSISKFAKLMQGVEIDCLVCNAGIQESTSGLGGKEAKAIIKRSYDGFEITVATNHIGHFLLCKLLNSNINSKSGRILFLGSGVHDPESPGGYIIHAYVQTSSLFRS